MNEHFFRNLLKIVFSYALYYTGVLFVLTKILAPRGLLIINYHGFSTFTNDYWRFGSLSASGYSRNFEKQVRYFARHLRKAPDFDLRRRFTERLSYVLTFDDGYRDNFEIALPVLVKQAVPAIFFLATGAVGTDRLLWHDAVRRRYESKSPGKPMAAADWKRRCKAELEKIKKDAGPEGQWMTRLPPGSPRLMMIWPEVRQAEKAGVLIGAHTHTHPILSSLSSDSQRAEILTSIEVIERETGRRPEFFSYTGGDMASFNEETVRIIKGSGIRYAVTTEEGINGPKDSDPLRLKRLGMNPSDPVPVVALKIALVELMAAIDLRRIKQQVARIQANFRQYGAFNSVKRTLKAVLRRLGTQVETYLILIRDLDGLDQPPDPVPGLVVKRLCLEDFSMSAFFSESSPDKRRLLERRFSDPAYQAFGAVRGGELVYMTWTATDSLRVEPLHFERTLEPGEGVLLDSMTLPKARNLGIHTFMSWYRLIKLKEMGLRTSLVAVLAENRPALKALAKIGFVKHDKLTRLKCGRFDRLYRTRFNGRKARIPSDPVRTAN